MRHEQFKVKNSYRGESKVGEEDEKEEFIAMARRRIGMSPFNTEDIRRNTMEGETYNLNKDIILMRAGV